MKKMMLKIALSLSFLLFCTAMMSYSIADINSFETSIQSEIKIFIYETEIPPSMKIAGFLDPLPDVLILITCHQLHYLHKAFILI